MESKEIYNTYHNKYKYTEWETEKVDNINGAKYHYCGTQDDLKKDVLKNHIDEFFTDEELYLATTRTKSLSTTKTKIIDEIERFIGKKEIGIIDKSLSKLIFINNYGTFQKGKVVEYPKSRIREEGSNLNFAIHTNILEKVTEKVDRAMEEPIKILEEKLNNDYGGDVEHLWIDIELVESHLKDRKPYSFRFQKRVSAGYYYYNVAHYSIAPDFEKLKVMPDELICEYILKLVFDSTQVLIDKKKKLNNFKAEEFRFDFIRVCNEMGYLKN